MKKHFFHHAEKLSFSNTAATLPLPSAAIFSEASCPTQARSESNSEAWLRLAEYGDWPHSRGLQRVSRNSAEAMVRYFKSLRGRLARKFGGLPVYIGHPDDAQFSGKSGHDDTRAYAWVTDLQARADGLYGAFKWSAAGEELLANAFYKFLSPRWVMSPIGNDVFEPVRLLSVGLTNQPNIPGDTIANSAPASAGEDTNHSATNAPGDGTVTTAIDSDNSTHAHAGAGANTSTHPTTTNDSISREALCAALGINAAIDPIEAIVELREQSERFYRIACDQNDALSRDRQAISNERREHIDLLLANAVLSGRITAQEQSAWQQALEEDWDEAHSRLLGQRVQLKITAIANALCAQKPQARSGERFIRLVEEQAKAKGLSFPQAWSALKCERPELYQDFSENGN